LCQRRRQKKRPSFDGRSKVVGVCMVGRPPCRRRRRGLYTKRGRKEFASSSSSQSSRGGRHAAGGNSFFFFFTLVPFVLLRLLLVVSRSVRSFTLRSARSVVGAVVARLARVFFLLESSVLSRFFLSPVVGMADAWLPDPSSRKTNHHPPAPSTSTASMPIIIFFLFSSFTAEVLPMRAGNMIKSSSRTRQYGGQRAIGQPSRILDAAPATHARY